MKAKQYLTLGLGIVAGFGYIVVYHMHHKI